MDISISNNNDFLMFSSSDEDSFHRLPAILKGNLMSPFADVIVPKNCNIAHYSDLLLSFEVGNCHAILVSETFLNFCFPSTSYFFPGFHLIFHDRLSFSQSGAAIYKLQSLINSSNLHILPLSSTHHFPNCLYSLVDLTIVSSLNHFVKQSPCLL